MSARTRGRARITCDHFVDVGARAVFDDAPLGALYEVQEVVIDPEANENLDGKL